MAVKEIRFSQSAILKILKDIFGASSPAGSTSTTSDDTGITQRPVDDYVILEKWDSIILELKRVHLHIFLLTGFDGIEIDPSFTKILKRHGILTTTEAAVAYRGALVDKSGNQVISTGGFVALSWDQENYDTDDIHDNSTNNTRLSVPVGVTRVRLTGGLALQASASGNERVIRITKNGSAVLGGGNQQIINPTASTGFFSLSSAVLTVVGGTDYFESEIFQDSGGNLNALTSEHTFFAMEIIE